MLSCAPLHIPLGEYVLQSHGITFAFNYPWVFAYPCTRLKLRQSHPHYAAKLRRWQNVDPLSYVNIIISAVSHMGNPAVTAEPPPCSSTSVAVSTTWPPFVTRRRQIPISYDCVYVSWHVMRAHIVSLLTRRSPTAARRRHPPSWLAQ